MSFGTAYMGPIIRANIPEEPLHQTKKIFSLYDKPELKEIEIDGNKYKYYEVTITLLTFTFANLCIVNVDRASLINKLDDGNTVIVNINNYAGKRRLKNWEFLRLTSTDGNTVRDFKEFVCYNEDIINASYNLVNCRKMDNSVVITNNKKAKNSIELTYKKIIINPPKTTVIWSDGTKTSVRYNSDTAAREFDPLEGVKLAACKRLYGDKFKELFSEVYFKCYEDHYAVTDFGE